MKIAQALCAALIVSTSVASLTCRADSGPNTVVYPTGVFPDDVTRVQAALDGGGTVLLKAVNAAGVPTSFNFGTGLPAGQSSRVSLTKDVSILGETTGSARTTILGGINTISCILPVRSTISGIVFERPIWDAIDFGASTGSTITDNVFHNVVPVRVRVPSGAIITFAQAIGFAGFDASGPAPQLITGKLIVSGNMIDGARALFSNGIQFDSFSASAEIVGNYIVNVNDDTTETGSGIAVIRAGGEVLIADNFIAPGPTQNFGADGIFIGGNDTARYQVIGNTIELVGGFPDGIDVAGGNATANSGTLNAVVVGNSIVTPGPYNFGIFLWDLVTKTEVVANSLQGSGYFALGVSTYGFDTNIASLNRFTVNDLSSYASNPADLFFDTNAQGNHEVGFCRSVIDLGTGNTSTCGTRTASVTAPSANRAMTIAPSQSDATIATKRQQVQLQQTLGRFASGQVIR